jgi:pimeloyl-ACP methyl ester carboxylesterase
MHYVKVNGVKIAYRVQGQGSPLVLVMGYRLNSSAWPPSFIEQLARRFTVISLDNRGTGQSDKPLKGYAIANMARDVCGLLDELKITRVHMLGYSMGGAIAQEFVRQFPHRVLSLILCATMAGGPRAKYAKASVVAVMRDLDGLSPEQAARRIWNVTYSPGYLEQHRDLAEEQMRREIALPTPLHAADLQFQAFAEFDGSKAVVQIRCPTLVLTGDLDELIPPENSLMMAKLIPGAKLAVIPTHGHRVFWETTTRCVDLIAEFINSACYASSPISADINKEPEPTTSDALISMVEMTAMWASILARAGFDVMALARQTMMVGSTPHFGDGKPIILVPRLLGSDLAAISLSIWLTALGYRPVTTRLSLNLEETSSDHSLARVIQGAVHRVGRKAVLIAHAFSMSRALRLADVHKKWISDVVIIGAFYGLGASGVRAHFVSPWSALHALTELPRVLRSIDLELIQRPELGRLENFKEPAGMENGDG